MFQTSPHSALQPFGTIEDRVPVLDRSHAMGGSLKPNGLAPYNSQLKGRNSLVFYSKGSLGAVTRIFMTLVIVGAPQGQLPEMYPLQPSTSNSNESSRRK